MCTNVTSGPADSITKKRTEKVPPSQNACLSAAVGKTRPDLNRHTSCLYILRRKSRPIDHTQLMEAYMSKDLEQRGLENQVKGAAKEMKGQVRGDLGDATDNNSEHIKGHADELEGKIQKNFGKA